MAVYLDKFTSSVYSSGVYLTKNPLLPAALYEYQYQIYIIYNDSLVE